jgi:hypothetical protein
MTLLLLLTGLPSSLAIAQTVKEASEIATREKHGYIYEMRARDRATVKVMPSYPEGDVEHGFTGIVRTKLEFTRAGDVIKAIVQPGIDPDIRKAVFDAVKQWKFKPSMPSVVFPAGTIITKLTFEYVVEDGKGRVEMYSPPDAKSMERLYGYIPTDELKEWGAWAGEPVW